MANKSSSDNNQNKKKSSSGGSVWSLNKVSFLPFVQLQFYIL